MHKLIGNLIEVCLKTDDPPLSGLLVSVEHGEIYIKSNIGAKIFVVPRQNIKYYITDRVPSGRSKILDDSVKETSSQLVENTPPTVNTGISIIVNGSHICNIPVPPTFELDVWHDDIMKVALGNPDVKSVMTGVVNKSVEYFPPNESGYAIIKFEVETSNDFVEQPSNNNSDGDNTFFMGGNPTSDYLSPAQMAARMSNLFGVKK